MSTDTTEREPINWRVGYVALNELVPNPENPKYSTKETAARLRDSHDHFGQFAPFIVNADGQSAIDGHQRINAWITHLGEAHDVEVRIPDRQLSAQEVRKLVLYAGKGTHGDFDMELLANFAELDELQLWGGFTDEELGIDFDDEDEEGNTDPDSIPEPPEVPTSVQGDIWILGEHRLCCGSSTEKKDVHRLLDGALPHLMVTDPPYGVEYDPEWRADAGVNKSTKKMGKVQNDDQADWTEAWALFPGDVAYVWHAGLFASVVADSLLRCGFDMRSQIIWAKDRFALSRGHYHWQHEPCWYAVRKNATGQWAGDRKQATLWEINSRDDDGVGHGTQKPVECMRRPIKNNSAVGDAIYEPFCGSGTTIIAAEMLGRHVFAMELDEKYCDVIVKRWQDYTGKKAMLEGTKHDFETIAVNRVST